MNRLIIILLIPFAGLNLFGQISLRQDYKTQKESISTTVPKGAKTGSIDHIQPVILTF